MRIAGWHVDGFGHLADLDVHDVPGGLVVLVGPNEAGKSTLADFLTGMLFGFPVGNTKLAKRPPLRGGDHGGRLWLVDGSETLLLSRTRRTLRIRRGSDDAELSESELGLLLGSASRRVYEAIFSVDVDDLHSLAALDDAALNDLVFSAGVVGAGRSATAAIDLLARRRAALYKPRGRIENYPVLMLRDELRDAEERLVAAQRAATGIPAQRRALATADQEAADLRVELGALEARSRQLSLLLDLWPLAVDAAAAAEARAALAPWPAVAPALVARLDGAEAAHQAAVGEAAAAAEAAARAEADALAARPGPESVAALAAAPLVDDLRHRSPLAARDRDARARAAAQAVAAEQALAAARAELGPEGDRAGLAEPALPIGAADALATRAEALDVARQAESAARAAHEQARQQAAEQAARIEARRAALAAEGPIDVAGAEARVAALDARLRELAAPRPPVASVPSPVAPAPALPAWAAPASLAVALTLALSGITLAATGAVPAGLLVAVAAVALGAVGLALRPPPVADARPEAPGAGHGSAGAPAEPAGAEFVAPPEPVEADPQAVAVELADARHARDAMVARAHEQAASVRDSGPALALDQARVVRAASALEGARQALAEARAAWSAGLVELGWPADLSPAGASRYAELSREAGRWARAAAQAQAEAQELAASVDRFEGHVAATADALGVVGAGPGPTSLDEVVAAVEQARRADAAHQAASGRAEAAAHAREVADARVAATRQALERVLADARVGSASDLRAAADTTAERERLDAVVAAFDRAVVVAAGAEGAPATRAALTAADPVVWEAERRELAGTHALAEERRDLVVAEAAELRRRLHALERSADVATLVLEVAGLRAELRAALREWTVLGLARGLVAETLARYQRERQPRVLARAQELFALVTEGRYPRLRTDDRVVVAIDSSGRDVPAGALSRGAQEQLYLCLRFALAESFAERASLPILLDDVLVNFDPARAARVAAVVAAVAERHQVLAFTCHPWVRDLLLDAAGRAAEIPLDRLTGSLVPIRHEGRTARRAPQVRPASA